MLAPFVAGRRVAGRGTNRGFFLFGIFAPELQATDLFALALPDSVNNDDRFSLECAAEQFLRQWILDVVFDRAAERTSAEVEIASSLT